MDGNFQEETGTTADRPLKAFGKKELLEILEDHLKHNAPFPERLTDIFTDTSPPAVIKNGIIIPKCVEEILRQAQADFMAATDEASIRENFDYGIRLLCLMQQSHYRYPTSGTYVDLFNKTSDVTHLMLESTLKKIPPAAITQQEFPVYHDKPLSGPERVRPYLLHRYKKL